LCDALKLKELCVDALTDLSEAVEILDPLVDAEIARVVDRRLCPERALFLEVLLDVRALELDVKCGVHALRDDPCAIAVLGRAGVAPKPDGKQEGDTVWPAEVEVVADDLLEEVATLDRPVEDLGEAEFDLPNAQLVVVAGNPVVSVERPWEPVAPIVEECLHVLGDGVPISV
jgi:hypothetical protein